MQTMDGIFTNLKRMFQSGNILSKLIYINVGLFILIRLASVLFMLFNVLSLIHISEPTRP